MASIKKGFYWHSQSWYSKSKFNALPDHITDRLTIGFYDSDGGTLGEFVICWEKSSTTNKVAPKLMAYDDSWTSLYNMPELIKLMHDISLENQVEGIFKFEISIDEFAKRLLEIGLEDLTMRTEQ